MSLSKQLMMLIAAMFLAVFAVNFVMSLSNIRDYLEIESETHAQDTATSLGLSLRPFLIDRNELLNQTETDTRALENNRSILETMINPIFDRGYYKEILLKDIDGEVLVEKANPTTFSTVPEWFVELLPMRTATVFSDVDVGWIIGGQVQVTIHPGFGYLKLWEQAKQTSQISAAMLIGVLILMAILIRLLLNPLRRIEKLAIQISEGKYPTIELPWTTEIRSVAAAMNLMSGKIERVISNLNDRLQEASKHLHTDALTGLATRITFETSMKERFMSNKEGHLFVIRIDDLSEYAKSHSTDRVDDLIKEFTHAILNTTENFGIGNAPLFRIVGAEFVLVCESLNREQAENLCKALATAFEALGATYEKPGMGHIGGVAFDPRSTTAALISAATEAHEKARIIGDNAYAFSEGAENARTIGEWHDLVTTAIKESKFDISYAFQAYLLEEGRENEMLIEEALSQIKDDQDQIVPIGTFVSIAETSGRITEFDHKVVNVVLDHIDRAQISHQIAVNLSMSSLRDNRFRRKLFELLEARPAAAKHLTFSITAYAATQDLESFLSFIAFAHRAGTRVMLKRYESRLIEVDKLGTYQLDFIRLARHYTEDLLKDSEKQLLVESMRDVGELLNVAIIAESVKDDADLKRLKQIGIQAASR